MKSLIFVLVLVFILMTNIYSQSEMGTVPPAWQTVAEQTEYKKTSTYDETVAFAKRLDAASPLIVS